MTEPLWLSRIRLKPDPDVRRLAARLIPSRDDGAAVAACHQLIWDVFADDPGRTRDFLWREDGAGRFLALSRRKPLEETALFAVDARPFIPDLAPGDRLRFALRANATECAPGSKTEGRRGARRDVVKALIDATPQAERAARRDALAAQAGVAWLRRQADAAGFRLPGEDEDAGVAVTGYRILRVSRGPLGGRGGPAASFGVFEFEGVLQVVDPQAFLAQLPRGYGRGKAFGFGLMLIRRAA